MLTSNIMGFIIFIEEKEVRILLEDFEEIRKELIYHLSEYLDLYIKSADIIYGKDTDKFEANLQVLINIMNKLEQLKDIDKSENVH